MASPGEAAEFGFTFCRIAYRSVRSEGLGQGWRTDYPNSDANFSLRFSQLTTSSVSRSKDGEPFYAVVTLEDDEIFRCPFVFMSDVGRSDSTARRSNACAPTCSRAVFSMWTTSGETGRGPTGKRSCRRCFPST